MSLGPQKTGAGQLGGREGAWSQGRQWNARRLDYLWRADEQTTFHMRGTVKLEQEEVQRKREKQKRS